MPIAAAPGAPLRFADPHAGSGWQQRGGFATFVAPRCLSVHSGIGPEHDPEAPDVIRGGYRFSEKIMLKP
jgi:hypothetical protein